MRVDQYMSWPVLTITPQTEFHRAFDFMHSRGIHHLPVVEGERLLGIVAERDLLLAAANFGSAEVPVGDLLRRPPVCVAAEAQLKQAAKLLVINNIGSLPVLNRRKKLVGIITETDIFKITAGMLRAHPLPKKKAKQAAGKPRKKAVKAAPRPARKPARKAAAKRK